MPGCGVLLPNWNVVWFTAYPVTGVAFVASDTEAAYGFSSMFEFFTPDTVNPGMPLLKKACWSPRASPSSRTGENRDWSLARYAGLVGTTPLYGFGAWPAWLKRDGFSSGTAKLYFAP